MEDPLQKVSNQHRTLYYASQLKVIDISQNIRAMGTKFTNNQIKTATLESFNHFCMLQKIFQEGQLTHIYQLVKTISQNYNSLIAILLERDTKLANIIASKASNNQKQEQGSPLKPQQVLPGQPSLMRQIKKNRLGGIHLFNQNYARYLQDHRIMDQIKFEKGKRLHRNRLEILRESIFEELNHKTDVEEFPAKNDEITNYIIKSKDKNSIFNYVSYEPELQEILTFFQNSQTEANDFLVRKVGKIHQEDGTFSFSDFQREIQMKNYNFKRQIIQKFREFIEKYRKKEEEMQKYINQKQAFFKQLQQRYFKREQIATQTDLNLDEYLKSFDEKLKQTQLRCQALQNMKKEQLNNNQKQSQLIHELAIRQNHIQKLNYRISEQQATIKYVKKLLRQEKAKKSQSIKQQTSKSQHIIAQQLEKQKQKQKTVVQAKESSEVVEPVNQQLLNLHSASQLRKTSYMSSWRRKQSNDGISLLSFNDLLDKQNKEHEALSRTEKKRYVRYLVQGKHNDSDKNQSYLNKHKIIQSADNYAQTDHHFEDYIQRNYIRDTSDKLQILPQAQQAQRKSTKKGKSTPSSTPKMSSRNVEMNATKKSNQKLDASKKAKQRKNITSLTKIKSQQDLSQLQTEPRKLSNQRTKKNSRRQTIKIFKQQKQAKKQEINKIQKLHFNQQPVSLVNIDQQLLKQQEQIKSSSYSIDAIVKPGQKRDQITYKIFQVVEEQDEENITIKNTQRSEKMSSIYSHKKLQFQLIDKLNKQLNRINQERHYTFQHLYNLTILPFQKHKSTKSGDVKVNHHSDWKADRTSIELTNPHVLQMVVNKLKPDLNTLDINNLLKVKVKDHGKSLSGLDDLIKAAPQNQIKREKLKNWKKKMANHLKSEIITQQQAQQIISVIRQSTKNHKQADGRYENYTSPISSIANHIRNSLPQVEDIFEEKPIKKATGCLRKVKLKTSCQQIEESNTKIDKFQDKMSPEIQKKIQQLIHAQALQPHFKQKFAVLHKKCREGTVCSHINKYFQTIMKHYEQSRRKGKQTLVLPIEHIGTRAQVQENSEKENKQTPRKIQNITHNQKQVSLSRSKNKRLSRKSFSQDLLLPNIKDFKANSKISKFVI